MMVHFKIYGFVQGVFFRHNTKKKAEDLKLCGWVRNNNDGSVEGEAFGEQKDLDVFVEWLKSGPSLAKVKKVEVNFKTESTSYTSNSFEILD